MEATTIITVHHTTPGRARLVLATTDYQAACDALDNIGVIDPAADWECPAYAEGGSEARAVMAAAAAGADPDRVDPISVWRSPSLSAVVWLEEHTV